MTLKIGRVFPLPEIMFDMMVLSSVWQGFLCFFILLLLYVVRHCYEPPGFIIHIMSPSSVIQKFSHA